jgi:hypothetical protein
MNYYMKRPQTQSDPSPGHRTADGRPLGTLRIGDALDRLDHHCLGAGAVRRRADLRLPARRRHESFLG